MIGLDLLRRPEIIPELACDRRQREGGLRLDGLEARRVSRGGREADIDEAGGAVPHGGKDKVSPAVFSFLLFIGTGRKRDIDVPDLLTEGGGVEIPGRDEAERGLPDTIARGDRLPKLITDLRTHPAPDRIILRPDRNRHEKDQT